MFRKADLIFVVLAVLVVVGVALLPSPQNQNPPIPKNDEHRRVSAEKDCLQCHAATGIQPLAAKHPKRQDCFRCHRAGKSL
jgi:uncharacterized paraquat-inducible protein A